MRHHRIHRKFGRKTDERRALLRSLAGSLIKKGKITTTEARAKELRSFLEKLITLSRLGGLATRRLLIARLGTSVLVDRMIKTVTPRYLDRPGGYTRISKLPARRGDGSPTALIELV